MSICQFKRVSSISAFSFFFVFTNKWIFYRTGTATGVSAEQFRQSVDSGSKLKYSSKVTENTRIHDKLTISEKFSFFCKLGKLDIYLLTPIYFNMDSNFHHFCLSVSGLSKRKEFQAF